MNEYDILYEELYENFESFDLLTALDHLDHIRGYISDQGNYTPPQVRIDLLELHRMVMDASNGSTQHSFEKIMMQTEEVEHVIYRVQEETEKIQSIISKLNDALNKSYDRIENLEEEE